MNIQIIVSLASLIASCGIAWGIVKQQLKNLEHRIADLEADNKTNRELLIEIKTKVEILLDGVLTKPKRK